MRFKHHNSGFLHFDKIDEIGGSCNANMYALVILNYKLPLLTLSLWKKAYFRICADGGANQLYDCLPKLISCDDPAELRSQFRPDVIKGDLDSVRPEVRKFYEELGTMIVDESYDQDTTDLHKCISYIKDQNANLDPKTVSILVLGGIGGRMDHEFGNFNVLFSFPDLQIILLNDESMVYLLVKDTCHHIHIDSEVEGPHCGLVPLGAPSPCTTTTGLKWNLDSTPMQFGGLISVCNLVEDKVITVCSDANLIWTIEIHPKQDDSDNKPHPPIHVKC